MGAEQSARLVCTETAETEKPLKLINSELFFRLYFEKMPQPVTGPVTEALLHLVKNLHDNGELFIEEVEVPQGEVDRMDSDTESGFNSDSTISVGDYDEDVGIEPIRVAEFDSMDEYDIPPPGPDDIIEDPQSDVGPLNN
ncbi:uncharacterized protein [Drosophila bipectinata]|uniref:uncharacterized protein isoform X1 n=1 Tax=Drosophila bipectinata TaxID=42026 RepID=UPI001C8A15D2|nr:uncharacterized protein LOC108125525 [Drosophila bipectinata]